MPSLTDLTQQAHAGTLAPIPFAKRTAPTPDAPAPVLSFGPVPHTPDPSTPAPALGAHPDPGAGVALLPPDAPETPSDYRTELITARELATLAGKLVRHPNEDKQSLGRALIKAIRGEPFAVQGQRNKTAFQLAGEIIEEYPNSDPATVIACLSASVSRVQDLGSKLTEDKWQSMLERLQDERRTRINMVKGVAGKLGRTLLERASQVTLRMPPSSEAIVLAQSAAGRAPYTPDPQDPTSAAHTPGADPYAGVAPGTPEQLNTLFILADGVTYLRRPGERYYRWALKSDRSIQVELANQFGTDNSTVVTHDAEGKAIALSELMPVYASNAHKIVHDYSSTLTTWDGGSATLHVGLPDEAPPAVCDGAVHAWLLALAGPGTAHDPEADVTDLYDWIAASSREHIASPAAGLVVVGDPNVGKGLLALALARTWGTMPVDLECAVERFNGPLLTSPFWHADERMPDGLTDAKYRKIVQDRFRLVEPKGREKIELRGCGRLVITLNEPEDLRMGGLEGEAAMKAVVDRIAYFDCTERTPACMAALDALRMGADSTRPNDVDLARVVGHLRWVQTEYARSAHAPVAQRFLGARADKSTARALVLQQGVARQNGDTLDAVLDYLRDPHVWEKSYHIEVRQFVTGQRFPAITQEGWLWIWPAEISARLSLRSDQKITLKRMLKSLRPMGQKPKLISFKSHALREMYWPVDPEKLVIAAGLNEAEWSDMVPALARDTRERLGLT